MGWGSPKAPIVVGALSWIGGKHPQLRQLQEEALIMQLGALSGTHVRLVSITQLGPHRFGQRFE